MNKAIVAYHKDEENHWVAELVCGHFQHVRNNSTPGEPPLGGIEGRAGFNAGPRTRLQKM
jgi:hypothetical protein